LKKQLFFKFSLAAAACESSKNIRGIAQTPCNIKTNANFSLSDGKIQHSTCAVNASRKLTMDYWFTGWSSGDQQVQFMTLTKNVRGRIR